MKILIENKNSLKYHDYNVRGDKVTVLGIGKKAIKFTINDGEEQFAFYDSFEGKIISKEMIKSFDNELWNEDIRSCIEAQKQFCRENKAPHFAPEDGFCFSCGKQIYTRKNINSARNELITGCPHCHRSYCD